LHIMGILRKFQLKNALFLNLRNIFRVAVHYDQPFQHTTLTNETGPVFSHWCVKCI
jgi:hypothetical protein